MGSLGVLGDPLGDQKGAKGTQKEPKLKAKGLKGSQQEAKRETTWDQKATMGAKGGQGRKKGTQGPPREDPHTFFPGSRDHPGG